MKKINILVVISFGLLFTACSSKVTLLVNPVHPMNYAQYQAVYQTNYDLNCSYELGWRKIIFNLKKGDALEPVSMTCLQGLSTGISFSSLSGDDKYNIPNHTIGLKGLKSQDFGSDSIDLYLLINPDGEISSNYALHMTGGIGGNTKGRSFKGSCSTHVDQPPFTLITNP